MKIEVGQDANGRWAWMLKGHGGQLIASDDGYMLAALAMEDALNQLELHERRARRHREAQQGGEDV